MTDHDAISRAKTALRSRMRESLRQMSEADRLQASIRACRTVAAMQPFTAAWTIMLYLSLPGEADCTSLIEGAFCSRKIVCVPHVDWHSRVMSAARIESLDPSGFMIDRHHVRVPRNIVPTPIETIDCVIVPGLAFDERGHRLGRGGGFYDRFLRTLPASTSRIGLAFERQVVPQLPVESHDSGVNVIVTEIRIVRCL